MIFCTLFDSNYLDKGIVLFQSLKNACNNFRLYVLAMDEKCFNVIHDMKQNNSDFLEVIKLDDFVEFENLKKEQSDRPRAEFCWTCTSHLVDYVINKCEEDICTYIDADMYFYQNPHILLDEMQDKSVQIVEHRFTQSVEDQISKAQSGTYCVEFNTFTSRKDSMELLQWWKKKCKESCSNSENDNKIFGDQMYLETWGEKSFVSILKNLGGGVAPWNIGQYKLIQSDGDKLKLKEKKSNLEFDLIFYHFHNLSYIDDSHVDISVYQRAWGIDDNLVNNIYVPYLKKLRDVKRWLLDEYNINNFVRKHPAFETKKNVAHKHTLRAKNIPLSVYLYLNSKLKKILVEKKNIIEF